MPSQFGGHFNVDLKQRIDAFLKKSFRYGLAKQIYEIQGYEIIDSAMHDLFNEIKATNHSLFHLLPPRRLLHSTLRDIAAMVSN